VKNKSALSRFCSSIIIFLPNKRIPVPASTITLLSPHKISKQVVLPPYLTVSGPGQGILPRVPQNFMLKDVGFVIIEIYTILDGKKYIWQQPIAVS
jgi:hypothetical protein